MENSENIKNEINKMSDKIKKFEYIYIYIYI